MMPSASRTLLITAFIACCQSPSLAQNSIPDAFANGNAALDVRYRFESVDEGGFSENAEAGTLRTRLRFTSGGARGWTAGIEFSDVRALGHDEYNAGAGATPDRVRFPVVADPEDTRLNQAWLQFRPLLGLKLRAGRQRIKLDNDRFIGNVGWRQNEQTYDGGSMRWKPGGMDFFYSYVTHVNRIFDSSVSAGDHAHDTHLFNVSGELAQAHTLTGYLYRIEDQDQQVLSNRTLGLRYSGSSELAEGRSIDWLAELAHQIDTGANPVDYSAGYMHVRAELNTGALINPFAGIERLGGARREGAAFRTPLATLHAFNGWADRFLATPDRGLEDIYAGAAGTRGRFAWTLIWHRFESETASVHFGDELDGSLSVKLFDRADVLLKIAHFESAGQKRSDTTKFWAQLSFAFP